MSDRDTHVENQHLYREIFNNSTNAIFILDKEGIFIEQNNASREMLGFPDDEIIGKYVSFLFDDSTLEFLIRTLDSDGIYQGEVKIRSKNGLEFYTELSAFVIYDDNKISCYVGVLRDITERVRSEAVVRESEEKLRRTFEGIPDPAYILESRDDGSIYVLNANRTIYSMTSGGINKSIGRTVEDVFSSAPEIVEMAHEVLKSGNISRRIVKFGGQGKHHELWVECTLTKTADNLILLVTEDITEKKKAHEALERSERDKSIILDNIGEHINFYKDTGMEIVWTNSAAADSLGMDPQQIVGLHCYELWHSRDEPCDGCPIIKAAKSGKNEVNEITTPDGRVWLIRGNPIHDDFGNLIGLVEVTREITDEKIAQIALENSEKLYRETLDSMVDAIQLIDREMNIVLQNKPLVDWMNELGFDSSIVGKHVKDAFPFLSDKSVVEYQQVFAEGKPMVVIESNELMGAKVITEVRKIPIIRNQQTEQIITIIRNITERYETELALRESEEDYRLLYENLPDALFKTAADGKITMASEKASDLFGYSIEELVGMNFINLVHPDERKRIARDFETGFSVYDPISIDILGLRKEGSTRHLHITNTLLRDEFGHPVGYQSLIRDVSEKERAIEGLREEEEKYRSLFNFSPVGIGVTDLDGKILDGNQHLCELLGYQLEELKQLTAADTYVNPEERLMHMETIEREGRLRNRRVTLQRKNGSQLEVLLNIDKVQYGDNEVHLSTLRDITELHNTRLALVEERARAEFFTDLMAHDLNNIHQGILVSLELILRETRIIPNTRQMTEAALSQVIKAIDLIANVRKLSRIEKRESELQRFSLYDAISQSIWLAERAFPSKKVRVQFGFEKEHFDILADEFIIELFYNLIHNAIKYDTKEIVEIRIDVQDSGKPDFLTVTIEDTGPGIPDERKREIFTRLEKGRTTGSGIGLTLVRRIVRHYDGAVWVEDRVPNDHNKGAKFCVSIPKAEKNLQ